MLKKIPALLLALLLLGSTGLTARAHPVPDMEKSGSITVELHIGGKKLDSGSLVFYRVGEIEETDGDYRFAPVGSVSLWGGSFGALDSPDTAASLYNFVREQRLPGTEIQVRDGRAVFTVLRGQLGLYLAAQQKAGRDYQPIAPFLIAVPNPEDGRYVYDVNATPKVGVLTAVTPTPAPTPAPTPKPGPKLPQTGQLNWPVAALAVLGMSLITAGILLRSSRGKRDYEG